MRSKILACRLVHFITINLFSVAGYGFNEPTNGTGEIAKVVDPATNFSTLSSPRMRLRGNAYMINVNSFLQ